LLSFLNVGFDLYVICDFACRLNNLFMIMFRCSRFVGLVYVWVWLMLLIICNSPPCFNLPYLFSLFRKCSSQNVQTHKWKWFSTMVVS